MSTTTTHRRWQQGQDTIEQELAAGRLERHDPADLDPDARLLDARRELARSKDPAVQDALDRYRAGERAMVSCAVVLLSAQGLRVTEQGGLDALCAAVTTQFAGVAGPTVFGPLERMRAQPDPAPDRAEAEALESSRAAGWAVEYTARLLSSGLLRRF